MSARLRHSFLICIVLLCGTATSRALDSPAVAGQPADEQPTVDPHAVAEGRTAEAEHHGESLWLTVARLLNFGLLVGGLAYFLGPLISRYLTGRGEQIRSDLVQAAAMRRTADAQLVEIDQRLNALPAELEELRRRGAQEIAAEETRIRAAADAERQRLLDHMRRDLDLRVRIARRELTREAAMLAVEVAERRIRASITAADHARLLDRYTRQLGAA